jgi:uncharacterized protein (TIGR00255 family)
MICSMTGYAAAAKELACGALSVELRSVNHRYLDIQVRLPDELRPLEAALRERIAAKLNRGKVECRVTFTSAARAGELPELNERLLLQLVALDARIRERFPAAAAPGVADILRWPGMLGSDALPLEELKAACSALLDQVLEEFTAAREREGGKLKALLLERAAAMEERVAEIGPRMPRIIAAYQEKLAARLKEAMAGGDEERIRQEVALFANRIDIDEELTRLSTHIGEVRRILDNGGAAGKKLDFLMQELNREANTLGSKSADIAVTQAAMDIKLLIEQMREQIQNIE